MSAGNLLQAALMMGMKANPDIHTKWISVLHKMGGRYGVALLTRAADTRIDMLLRVLEEEAQQRIQQQQDEINFADDLQLALSEYWMSMAYEIVRFAVKRTEDRSENAPKLFALHERLALVRMPVDKYMMASHGKSTPRLNLRPIGDGADREPEPYREDGSYIVPRGFCTATGSVVWWPIDISVNAAVPIIRRELSDQFLAVFD